MAVFTIGSSSVSGNNGGGDPPPSGGAVGGADNLTNNGAITQVSGAGVISESFVSQSGGTVTVEDTTAVTGDTRLVVKEGAGQDGPLQAWRTAGGDTVASLSNDAGAGTFKMSDGTNTGTFAPTYFQSVLSADGTTNVPFTFNASTLTIQDTTATTGDTKLVVKAGAGQAGNLQEWQDAAGNKYAYIDSGGQFNQTSNAGLSGVQIVTGDGDYVRAFTGSRSIFLGATGIAANDSGAVGAFDIDATTLTIHNSTAVTGDTKLVVKAGAGQAGNLQEWQDAAGGASVAVGDDGGGYLSMVNPTTGIALSPDGFYYYDVATGEKTPSFINSSTLTIQDDTTTTGATLVDIVAGAAQTTKSVVLQTGGRIQAPLTTPTTSGETGTAGTIAWDASYIYICTSANTWKRVALSAF